MTAIVKTRAVARLPHDALRALHWIEQNGVQASGNHDRWIKAFLAVRWVVEAEGRLRLTPAGRLARDEISKDAAIYVSGQNPNGSTFGRSPIL